MNRFPSWILNFIGIFIVLIFPTSCQLNNYPILKLWKSLLPILFTVYQQPLIKYRSLKYPNGQINPNVTFSQTEWKFISTCLVHLCRTQLLNYGGTVQLKQEITEPKCLCKFKSFIYPFKFIATFSWSTKIRMKSISNVEVAI